jgi:hypothetical protein
LFSFLWINQFIQFQTQIPFKDYLKVSLIESAEITDNNVPWVLFIYLPRLLNRYQGAILSQQATVPKRKRSRQPSLLFLFSAQEPNQKWFYFQFSIAYRSVAIFSSTSLKSLPYILNVVVLLQCQFGFRLVSADKISIVQHGHGTGLTKVEVTDRLANGVSSFLKVTCEIWKTKNSKPSTSDCNS